MIEKLINKHNTFLLYQQTLNSAKDRLTDSTPSAVDFVANYNKKDEESDKLIGVLTPYHAHGYFAPLSTIGSKAK